MSRVGADTHIMRPDPAEVLDLLRSLPSKKTPWKTTPRSEEIAYLARGEYSLNYLIGSGEPGISYVARLVTGSQMDLSIQEQAHYEYHALGLIEASGVTPAPHLVYTEPSGLPYPIILEDYLPGRPLSYATDLSAAGRCVAAIHILGVPDGHDLQTHPDPSPAVLDESAELVEPYLEWDGSSEDSKEALRAAFDRIRGYREIEGLFKPEDLAIVNYDLNTHNFVVEDGRARLLDWEKARIAPRTEDVAHFLLPTTTLWRDETAARLTPEQEQEFLDVYVEQAGIEDRGRFETQLTAVKLMISLRAVSWCAWALQAHERGERAAGDEMLNKARRYLEPGFLEDLFGLKDIRRGG